MISVGVLGAKGRMGSEVCRAVEAAPDRVRRGDRHAEQHRVPEELAAVDLAIGELAFQRGDEDVVVGVAHDWASRRQSGDSVDVPRRVVNGARGQPSLVYPAASACR